MWNFLVIRQALQYFKSPTVLVNDLSCSNVFKIKYIQIYVILFNKRKFFSFIDKYWPIAISSSIPDFFKSWICHGKWIVQIYPNPLKFIFAVLLRTANYENGELFNFPILYRTVRCTTHLSICSTVTLYFNLSCISSSRSLFVSFSPLQILLTAIYYSRPYNKHLKSYSQLKLILKCFLLILENR